MIPPTLGTEAAGDRDLLFSVERLIVNNSRKGEVRAVQIPTNQAAGPIAGLVGQDDGDCFDLRDWPVSVCYRRGWLTDVSRGRNVAGDVGHRSTRRRPIRFFG